MARLSRFASARTASPVTRQVVQIDDLNARYAQTIDDDKLEAWPEFFTADGTYAIVPRENLPRTALPGMTLHGVASIAEALAAAFGP